jgi:hypothetical protein
VAVAVIGCSPSVPAPQNAAQDGCEAAARRTLTFSDPAKPDVLEARAFGPSCELATMVVTLRAADGAILHTYAQPVVAAILPGSALPPEQSLTLLEAWVAVTPTTTAQAPDWRADKSRPNPPGERTRIETWLTRTEYSDIRRAGGPMICYARTQGTQTCLYSRPSPAGAVVADSYHTHAAPK